MSAIMKKSDVQVVARSIVRKRKVYDASGTHNGIHYRVTGNTRAEAIALAIAEVTYIASAGELSALGFHLYAHGDREWFFAFPHKGGMGFRADNLAAALARVASDYHYHEEVSAFVAAVSAKVA